MSYGVETFDDLGRRTFRADDRLTRFHAFIPLRTTADQTGTYSHPDLVLGKYIAFFHDWPLSANARIDEYDGYVTWNTDDDPGFLPRNIVILLFA